MKLSIDYLTSFHFQSNNGIDYIPILIQSFIPTTKHTTFYRICQLIDAYMEVQLFSYRPKKEKEKSITLRVSERGIKYPSTRAYKQHGLWAKAYF